MKLIRILSITIVAALLGVLPRSLPAQAPRPEAVGLRPDAPIYAKHGPYWIGVRDLVIDFKKEGVALPVTLWYPAINPNGLKESCSYLSDTRQLSPETSGFLTTLAGSALRDAAPDPAGQPYPLVVFSSDNTRSRVMYARLLERLASQGFAVLGVDHVQETYTRRPKDIEHALDFALQPGALPVAIDSQQIALFGSGEGAKTVMQVSGVSFSRSKMDSYDRRVKAVVSATMSGETVFMNASRVVLPMLFLLGSKDRFRALPDMEEIYQAMPAVQKALVVLVDGGGELFTDPALRALNPKWDWGSLDLDRAHDLINHFTVAFLLDALKGDRWAHKALLPEAVKFEEIQYTTTLK